MELFLAYLISSPVIVLGLIFVAFVFVAPGMVAREMIQQDGITSWHGRVGAVVFSYGGIWGGFLILAVIFGRVLDVTVGGGQ
jgi:hypothetical protein